jgi:hypothetical protein
MTPKNESGPDKAAPNESTMLMLPPTIHPSVDGVTHVVVGGDAA